MSQLDANWIAVAQVYAALAAGHRAVEAALSGAGAAGWASAQKRADNLESMAQAAIRAAGVEG